MRPGRLPEDDPREKAARAKLRQPSVLPPPILHLPLPSPGRSPRRRIPPQRRG